MANLNIVNRKAHGAKIKQKQVSVKEIKFRPSTDQGDYEIKLKNLIKFLNAGDKVKVTIKFRGRNDTSAIWNKIVGKS